MSSFLEEKLFWTQRYIEQLTGWDIGYVSTPIKAYIDQLNDKNIKILIPGAGNAYEAEYLWQKGFKNVHVLDISEIPLQAFTKRNPDFPYSQLHCVDYFAHKGTYDLILEQTFFCSMVPTHENRMGYAEKTAELLKKEGSLAGVWFDFPMTQDFEKRPFGGDRKTYLAYFEPYFNIKTLERCYNSIPSRKDRELFGIFIKKSK